MQEPRERKPHETTEDHSPWRAWSCRKLSMNLSPGPAAGETSLRRTSGFRAGSHPSLHSTDTLRPVKVRQGSWGVESEAEVPGDQPAKKHAHILYPGSLSSLIPGKVSGSVTSHLSFLFIKKQ